MTDPTQEIVDHWCALIAWAIRTYRWHPEWEDMECECRLAVLKMLAKLSPSQQAAPDALIIWHAKKAAVDFLRSPRNCLHRRSRRGNPLLDVVYLDEVDDWGSEEPSSEDPAQTVIEKRWIEEVARLADAKLRPGEWAVIRFQAAHGRGALQTLSALTSKHPQALQSLGTRGMARLRYLVKQFEKE